MPNGKRKGSEFERQICRDLSGWISHGEREDLFWRSAMSGGRATVAAKSGKMLRAQCGDITAVDPAGNILTDNCYFECKHLKRLSFDSIIKESVGRGTLLSIWCDTVDKAALYSKHPVLICRQNGFPTLVCSSRDGIKFLCYNTMPVLTAPGYDLHAVQWNDMICGPSPKWRKERGK